MRNTIILTLIGAIGLALASFTAMKNEKVKHVVVFKYKPGTTDAQISQITNAFRDLKGKIPGIVSFETGVNHSPEKLDKGFTHVYLVTFDNVAARDTYLPHPEHKKFGELLGELQVVQEVFVVDFTPEN
jgi:hypothetical protein